MSTRIWATGEAGHLPPDWGMRLLNNLAVGWIEGNLFYRCISSGRGRGLFPQTQVLKDLFDDLRLVNKADDAHFSLALRAGQRVCFVDFSDEIGPPLL